MSIAAIDFFVSSVRAFWPSEGTEAWPNPVFSLLRCVTPECGHECTGSGHCWNAGVMPNYINLFVLCFLTKRIVSSALVFSAVALVRQGYQGGEVMDTRVLVAVLAFSLRRSGFHQNFTLPPVCHSHLMVHLRGYTVNKLINLSVIYILLKYTYLSNVRTDSRPSSPLSFLMGL